MRYLAIVLLAACSNGTAAHSDPAPAPPSLPASPATAPSAPAPAPASTAASLAPPVAALTLDIPARDQAPERPDEGWCAETAIQEAILFHSDELVPQADINAAGKPRNPDLYWSDVPIAMRALDLRYTKYTGGNKLDTFLIWVRERIRAGHPVIAGVKLYPTSFPQWGLDHIVLIVGFEDDALVINTTWGTRQTRSIAELTQTEEGISLANRYGDFFAYAIEGRTRS